MTDEELNRRFEQVLEAMRDVKSSLDLQKSRERIQERLELLENVRQSRKPMEQDDEEEARFWEPGEAGVLDRRIRALKINRARKTPAKTSLTPPPPSVISFCAREKTAGSSQKNWRRGPERASIPKPDGEDILVLFLDFIPLGQRVNGIEE
jgi:hypothetical protein